MDRRTLVQLALRVITGRIRAEDLSHDQFVALGYNVDSPWWARRLDEELLKDWCESIVLDSLVPDDH